MRSSCLSLETEERVDVPAAIDELVGLSFIEIVTSPNDHEYLISVPGVAAAFGRKKLKSSPLKVVIERDVYKLQRFGAIQRENVVRGVQPLIDRYLGGLATALEKKEITLQDLVPRLEYLAGKYPDVYLKAVEIFKEFDQGTGDQYIARFLQMYLEINPSGPGAVQAWDELAHVYRSRGDTGGEIHALVEKASLADTSFFEISRAANVVNQRLKEGYSFSDTEARILQLKALVSSFKRRIDEGDGTDFSKLAWLCLNMKDTKQAKEIVSSGLARDPENSHLQNLRDRLEPVREVRE